MLDGIKNRIQKFLLEKATVRYEREVYRQMQPYEQWIALHEWKTEKRSETGKETEKETEKITVVRFSECGGAFHVSGLDGEIIVFMEDYGALSSRALDTISHSFEEQSVNLVYADEDYYEDAYGKRSKPWFKPEWSPDTLLSYFYLGSMVAVRKQEILSLQHGNDENGWVNVYDLVLRLTEKCTPTQIVHLDEVLYHTYYKNQEEFDFDLWMPGSGSEFQRIKLEALQRRGLAATFSKEDTLLYHLKENPLVSILIPSRNNPAILKKCLESIKNNTSYSNYEILVIDNGSSGENRLHINELTKQFGFRHMYRMMEFNFSAMCNYGVEHANGKYLLLLNDDCEIVQSDWLERLLGQAMLPHIGAVGAKLLYPENHLIQHAGVTNLEIGPAHKLIAMSDDQIYYHGINRMAHNMIGVTAACLMVEKKKYLEVGGFCESMKVAYNDVDFCFALWEAGYYNCIRNDVILLHYESLTRGNDGEDAEKWMRLLAEKTQLYARHPQMKGRDPFYSSNLVTNAREYRCNYLYEYEKTDCFTPVRKLDQLPVMEENESLVISMENAGLEKIISQEQKRGYLIEGWCYLRGMDNARYQKKLYLIKEEQEQINNSQSETQNETQNESKKPIQIYELQPLPRVREDVTQTFPEELHTELSGFVCRIAADAENTDDTKESGIHLPAGTYTIRVAVKDSCSRQFLYQDLTQKFVVE